MYKNLNCELIDITGRQSEIIELALTFGFQGLDVDILDIVKRCSRSSLESATRFLSSSKLKVGSFQIPVNLDTDDAAFAKEIEELQKVAEVAGRIEARVGVISIPSQTDRLPYHEYFEVVRGRISQIVETCAKEDVKVALEFSPSYQEEAKQFKFVKDIEGFIALAKSCPGTGVVLDLWTWFCGGAAPEDLSNLGPERVLAVRLADCKPEVSPDTATPQDCELPGTSGVIDPMPYLSQLAESELSIPVMARGSFSKHGGKRDDFLSTIHERLNETLTTVRLPSQLRKPTEEIEENVSSNAPA
ncbi:MAG: sugar phosphate isomerase/epimerase [Planctomycetota bacterium]